MKCKLISEQKMVNPLWLGASEEDRKGMQEQVPVPEGTVIDNPDAWMLCMLDVAVPEDDECKEAVDKALGSPRRKQMLQQVLRLRAANGVQQLDKKSLRWLEYMEQCYAKELAELSGAANAKPAGTLLS